MSVVVCIKNCRSIALRISSRSLLNISWIYLLSKGEQNLHDGSTNDNNSLPLESVQRKDGEQTLKEGNIEEGKVKRH